MLPYLRVRYFYIHPSTKLAPYRPPNAIGVAADSDAEGPPREATPSFRQRPAASRVQHQPASDVLLDGRLPHNRTRLPYHPKSLESSLRIEDRRASETLSHKRTRRFVNPLGHATPHHRLMRPPSEAETARGDCIQDAAAPGRHCQLGPLQSTRIVYYLSPWVSLYLCAPGPGGRCATQWCRSDWTTNGDGADGRVGKGSK